MRFPRRFSLGSFLLALLFAGHLLVGCGPTEDDDGPEEDTGQMQVADSGTDSTLEDTGVEEDTEPVDTSPKGDGCTPSEETCNGEDDDCDGEVDENLQQLCGKQDGICQNATVACINGSYPECGSREYGTQYQPDEQTCDGVDNDCDGETDEGFKGKPQEACDGSDSDQCKNGTWRCNSAGNGVVCKTDMPADITETCDRKDNDCDGEVDEAATCDYDTLLEAVRFRDVAADDQGNVYVIGETKQKVGSVQVGDNDVVVAKYDYAGSRQWLKQFGSPESDVPRAVGIGPSGDIYVAGETRGALAQANKPDSRDAFVAQFDPSGTNKNLGQYPMRSANVADLTFDSSGRLLVAGTNWNRRVDLAVLGIDAQTLNRQDMYFDRNNTRSDNDVTAITTDASDNIYVAVNTVINSQDHPTIVKLAWNSGSLERQMRQKAFNNGNRTFLRDIAVAGPDKLLLVGTAFRDLRNHTISGNSDAFLADFDIMGNPRRIYWLATPERDYATGLFEEVGGDWIVTGRAKAPFSGSSGTGMWHLYEARYSSSLTRQSINAQIPKYTNPRATARIKEKATVHVGQTSQNNRQYGFIIRHGY